MSQFLPPLQKEKNNGGTQKVTLLKQNKAIRPDLRAKKLLLEVLLMRRTAASFFSFFFLVVVVIVVIWH